MKYGTFLNPQKLNVQETYELKIFRKIKGNNAYEYEDVPYFTARCRPATNLEKKTYRVTKGVNTAQNSVTLYCSNLPNDISPEDRVTYLGKTLIIKNIGYFVENANFTNAGIFSNKTLLDKYPKGLQVT